jgi:hypothetical protein
MNQRLINMVKRTDFFPLRDRALDETSIATVFGTFGLPRVPFQARLSAAVIGEVIAAVCG